MKKYLFVANWKLHGSMNMISNYFKFLKPYLPSYSEQNIIVFSPPTIYLNEVKKKINNIDIFLGAQDVDIHTIGAFTGETSILMLKDMDVKYVIIGHSERRQLHHESNDMITEKFYLIKTLNLIPILCIGETAQEKKSGQTKNIIEKQLSSILKKIGVTAFRNTVIAYEPIWAIGTGLSADPKNVQLIHQFIRNYIKQYDSISAENILIPYGGSINSINAAQFLMQTDINGLLIGSASLDAKEFLKILEVSNDIVIK